MWDLQLYWASGTALLKNNKLHFTSRLFQFTTVGDCDRGLGAPRIRSVALNLLENIHTLGDFTEYHMATIQPRRENGGDKELATIRVGAGIGHGQKSRCGVLELKVLIGEFVSVDGNPPSAISPGKVTTLAHEIRDNTVKLAALVSHTFFACAKCSEILCCLGRGVCKQLKFDAPSLGGSNVHIEEHIGTRHSSVREREQGQGKWNGVRTLQ